MAKVVSRLARIVAGAIAAALVIALLLAGCLWLERCRIACAVLRAVLPHGDGFENSLVVRQLDFRGVEIADARLGGFPCAPTFKSLRARWTADGLRERRIDAIELDALGIDAAHRVPGFKLPALGAAGWPQSGRDILKGWTVGKISANTDGALDFSALLPTNAPPWATGAATGRFSLAGGLAGDAMQCRLNGALCGMPFTLNLSYSPETAAGEMSMDWRLPGAARAAAAALASGLPEGPPIRGITAGMDFAFAEARGIDCSASGRLRVEPCEWDIPLFLRATPDGAFSFGASVDGLRLTEADPLVVMALSVATAMGAHVPDELAFSGELEASASVHGRGDAGAAPRWKARAAVSDLSMSLKAGTVPLTIEGGRARGSAEGSGGITRIAPSVVGFDSATIGAIPFGKGRATLLADEKSLVVSEASAGFCGGAVRLYALYLNLERLSAGFTIYLDNLRLSEALNLFPQLAGSEATGSLHGRLPLRCTSDGEVRLGEGFIYTPPGETGNVKVANATAIGALLAQTGLPAPVADNLAKALRNLDYDVLRLDLVNPRGEDGRVAIRLQGKSRDGKVVTPVNVNASINGPIEQFLNMAIRMAKIGKQ